MTLAAILADLLTVAPGQQRETRLGSGLKVTVSRLASTGRAVISCSRSSTTPPSKTEAVTLARDAGWPNAEISGPVEFTSGFKGYIINEPRVQQAPAEQGRLL